MRISDIINLLKEYIILGIVAIIFAGIVFLIGYKIIYRKVMKGTKTVNKRKMILYAISICYAVVVLGAVFLNRNGLYGKFNLHLFSSYKEAYHKMEISLFRNIILNILLFVPLGFLLPIYSDKLKKIYKTVPIGFATTLLIEIVQYVTRLGIFEIDDVFNNTLGTLIGYCLYMIYHSLKKKENQKYIIGYVLPMLATILVFVGIYVKYESQELGNLGFEYNYEINMKDVKVKNEADLENESSQKNIYYTKILTESETREIAKNIFENLGTSISEDDIDIYENTVIYYSNNREYNVWVKYRGGTYSFTDYSKFTHDEAEMIDKKGDASREDVENALQQMEIEIPENAEFKVNDDGEYIFSIDMQLEENDLIDGTLRCSYYEDGTIKDIQNNMVKYEMVMTKEIISEEEAYNQILQGKFQYYINEIDNIIIEDVELRYLIDTKGYYVPIYVFECEINNYEAEISIEAIK